MLLALNGSMVFVGQGLGAAIGAATIALFDVAALGFVAAVLALGGMVMAAAGSRSRAAAPILEESLS